MKKTALVIIATISLISSFAYSTDKPENKKPTPKRFFVAKTEFGTKVEDIKAVKVDAAMNFAAHASAGKFEYVPFAALDSILIVHQKSMYTLTSLKLAAELHADFFLFVRVNTLENMLRIDIGAVSYPDTSIRRYGTGYAALRYRNLTDEKPLYDPALLTSAMRAFAVMAKDSALFVLDDTLQVRPVPTLVVGGINYKDDEKQKDWEVFKHREISSYDAVENIFDEIKDNQNFAIFDIPTRDSMFALYNLLMIENYRGPTANELKILHQMDVNYYITGQLGRLENGALLDLYLCRIGSSSNIEIIDRETGLLTEDSIKEYNKITRSTVSKLMSRKQWLAK